MSLVTVLKLQHNKINDRYYIESQNDLYQVDQFVKFVAPGGWVLVWLWQFWATVFCVLGTVALWPVSVVEEWAAEKGRGDKGLVDGIELRDLERKGLVDG